MRASTTLAAVVLLATGCGAVEPSASPQATSPSGSFEPGPSAGHQTPAESTLASPLPSIDEPTTMPSAPAPTGSSRAAELGLADIELTTPVSGGGRRPVLEWAPLADTAYYYVVVRAPSGGVYWGWRTNQTSVPVGGLPRLSEDAAGPAISAGMTWSVSAVDGQGRVIGLSGHRPISP